MRIINFPHQYSVLGPGQYIESWRVPCEGALSRVEGGIIIIAKDYTNQPTFSQVDITWLNSVYHLMPDATLQFAATFAGLAVVPTPTFKDNELMFPVEGIITRGGELLTITITATAVPDPFMFYFRPMIKVYGLVSATKPNQKGLELQYTPNDKILPYQYDSARPAMNGEISGIEVIKEAARLNK